MFLAIQDMWGDWCILVNDHQEPKSRGSEVYLIPRGHDDTLAKGAKVVPKKT